MVTILAARGDELLTKVSADDLPKLLSERKVTIWVDLEGPADDEAVRIVRDIFKFHPLAIDDCFGAREHPKIEQYDGYVYLITHGLAAKSTSEKAETIELDAFLGKRFLVTHHSAHSRSAAQVVELVQQNGDFLHRGPAVVLHAILERQADGIETVLDEVDERIAALEDRVIVRPRPQDLALLLALRRNILQLRRWMTKQRDVVLRLARNEFPILGQLEMMLFRDVFDRLQRFTDLLENYRELTTSVQEAYLTMANNRLNEVMKFLTVFTSILIPLTVITGIYGMNFEYMPELHWKWGYPAALVVMVLVSLGMLWFFRRKGWLGRDQSATEPEPRDTIQAP